MFSAPSFVRNLKDMIITGSFTGIEWARNESANPETYKVSL
jgi:hypothetical protein